MGEFTDSQARKAKGSQGKSAEKAVGDWLAKKDAAELCFDWHRAYDARSAGGKFQRITGDFSFYMPQRHGIIEVKETEYDNHLPFDNYENSQVAKAVKRKIAGGRVIVVVHSTSTDRWRWFNIEFFQHRDRRPGVASWFFNEEQRTYDSVDEILYAFFTGYLPGV